MTRVRRERGRRLLVALGALAFAPGCSGSDVVLYRGTVSAEASLVAGGAKGDEGGGSPPPSGGSDGIDGGASGGKPGSGGSAPGDGGAGGSGGVPPTSGGAGGGAGSAGAGGIPSSCTVASDCPTGWTCEKRECFSASGQCVPRPILCDQNSLPVCGCDHVTYWNECVRQQNGVPASTIGQCGGGALPCMAAADCGFPGASCAHVIPTTLPCNSPGPGTCWVTPTDCTGTPASPKWVLCSPTGPLTCADTCTAIRSGLSYVAVSAGPGCP